MALEEIFRREFAELDRALVQDQVIAALQADPEAFIRAYRQHADSFGGRYVSTDLAKELFEQYAASRESRGRYNAAVHNAAAVLAGEQFRRAIQDASDPTRISALFLTGMPGAGKTTALQGSNRLLGTEGFAPGRRVIFEGQMVNPTTSIEKVAQALEAGLQASLRVILPKPEDALANTFRRFQELGRGATIDVMAQIQEGLPAGLRALQKEFGERLQISVFDVRVRSIPVQHDGEDGIVVIEKELENGSVRDRLLAAAERHRESGAIDHDCYQQCLGLAPYGQRYDAGRGHDGELEASARGRGVSQGSGQAHKLDRPAQLDADRRELGDLDLVNVCIWQLNRAAAIQGRQDPARAELVAIAMADLAAAIERPAVLAAFGDSYSHPRMITSLLEEPTTENIDVALEELVLIKGALVDRYGAMQMLEAAQGLQRLDGPTPWDTFFADPQDPDKALMPLFGAKGPGILGVGPIDGHEARRSEGGQALFYPVGGYDRFAEATSVIVAQSLADGLAINDAMCAHSGCAVVVASSPEGVADVCFDVNQALIERAALAGPGERGAPSLVAALTRPNQDGQEVKRLLLEESRTATAIVAPSAEYPWEPRWPNMAMEAIEQSVRSGQVLSNGRLEDAAAARDERLDHGAGFRESVRELREAVHEADHAPKAAPRKIERERSRSLELGR